MSWLALVKCPLGVDRQKFLLAASAHVKTVQDSIDTLIAQGAAIEKVETKHGLFWLETAVKARRERSVELVVTTRYDSGESWTEIR